MADTNNQKFIKSYSVFVKKKTHQQINDGTIFERDWLTTGGVDKFLPGQIPIYKNGNFIITVNNDSIQSNDYITDDYEQINGQDEWTLEEIQKAEANEENTITPDNLLKNNTYDLRDFAYFGSCVELIRGTMNGLLQNFPGELYFSNSFAYYTYKAPKQEAEIRQINVNGYQYVVSNPFNINIHLSEIRNPDNPLKYFANGGYKNYEIIIGNATNGTEITSFSVSPINDCAAIGEDIATIQINSYIIKYVKGESTNYYMHNAPNSEVHIRPKKEIIDSFFSNLDSFELVLLNRNTSPKYTSKFNIIQETDYGVKTVCESFTFPTGEGGYNLGGSSEIFSSYLKRLIGIAELYDERYSDNIYRMLTHETLKNFDFTMYKDNPNQEDYEEGNDRLKKVLRLYGREFDEIRNDIEAIKDNYFLGYKELSEEQRKLLKFKLINEGFDVKNIYPLTSQSSGECYKFSVDISSIYQPYNETYNYYYNNGVRTRTNTEDSEIIVGSGDDYCIARVFKKYKTNNTFNSKYINDEFFKRLRLNSRRILRHKGTATGIEMMLSLFGLKSKRMVNRMDKGTKEVLGLAGDTEEYDYDITEYWIDNVGTIQGETLEKLKFYNSTKVLDFNNDSIYAGLPVKEVDGVLYAFFDDKEYYDGFMHYQMNGGWLNYNGQVFNKDNCLVEGGYTDTLREVRTVNSIDELLTIPYEELVNGMYVKILNRNTKVAITDTQTYNILYDTNDINKERPYVYLYANNGYFSNGNKQFQTISTVSYNKNNQETQVEYDATHMPDGKQVKVYLNNNDQLNFDYNGYEESKITRTVLQDDASMYRKYYRDENSTDFNTLNNWLTIDENEYKNLNKVVTYKEGNNPHNPNPEYDNGEEYLNRFRSLFKYALENDMFDTRCYGSIAQYYREKPEIAAIGFSIGGESSISVADRDTQSPDAIKVNEPIESYQKMALKRLNFDFTPLFNKLGAGVEFRKYFLSIIMSYCSQFIPSTAICSVNIG